MTVNWEIQMWYAQGTRVPGCWAYKVHPLGVNGYLKFIDECFDRIDSIGVFERLELFAHKQRGLHL